MKLKKITSLLLAGLMLAGSAAIDAVSVSALEDKSDFEYDVTASGDAVITDYLGDKSDITIPGSINGHKVTAIGGYSFAYDEHLDKVTIPSSVKSIGSGAFSCCVGLTTVNIPDSVTSIRLGAFSGCENLYQITLPSKLSSIEDEVFWHTALTKIEIPAKVTSIGTSAFAYCGSLESITVPDTVNALGESAFYRCASLSSVKLSSNLTEIKAYMFSGDTELTSIAIPSKVKKIKYKAFAESGIKKISISKKVSSIADEAFLNCFNLKSITVSKKNNYYSSKSGVLYNKKKTKLLTYPAGKTAKNLTVPKSVKTIYKKAFYKASKLGKITFNKGVKTIGMRAFDYCAFKSVKLPSTVKKIGMNAFKNNLSLKTVSIPKSVTEIKSNAFAMNTALKTVKFEGNSKLKLGWGVFEGCKSLRKISIPKSKSSDGGLCFACNKLKTVKISKDIKKIYREDFAECRKLNKVTVPKTVKKIGKYALGYINYYDYSYDKNDNFKITGYKDSAAHKYAKKNGFLFKKLK